MTWEIAQNEARALMRRAMGAGRWWVGRRPRRQARTRVGLVWGWVWRGVLFLHGWYMGVILILLGLYTFVNPPMSALMLYRRVVNGFEVVPVRFLALEDIPKSTRRDFLTLEDHHFYEHSGIHLGAIREAMERNVNRGALVYGGSTISQQTVKNLFLVPDRWLLRKYLEVLAVFPAEWILGKDRIFELYLNYIEFGPGIHGLENGARHQYGGTSFLNLSRDRRIRLAVIITSPLRYTVKNFQDQRGMLARYRALTR